MESQTVGGGANDFGAAAAAPVLFSPPFFDNGLDDRDQKCAISIHASQDQSESTTDTFLPPLAPYNENSIIFWLVSNNGIIIIIVTSFIRVVFE